MHGKLHRLGGRAASGRNSQGGNIKISAPSKFGTHSTSPFALGMRRTRQKPTSCRGRMVFGSKPEKKYFEPSLRALTVATRRYSPGEFYVRCPTDERPSRSCA